MFPRRRYRVAVLGATGAVGTELLKELDGRRFPTSEVRALCSPKSAGGEVSHGNRTLIATAAVEAQFEGVEIVFSAAGDEAAAAWLPAAQAAGAVCIDTSGWSRAQGNTPLVVPEVNPEGLAHQTGLVASPGASTIAASLALAPLKALGGGIDHVVVTSMEPASGAGQKGLTELSGQAVSLLNFRPVEVEVHPARLAFNCIPQVGALNDAGVSAEERTIESGLKTLLDVKAIATCVRVPVFVGLSLSLTVRLKQAVTTEAVTAALATAPGLSLVDDREPPYPMVMDVSDEDYVQVGRVRVDGDVVRLWVVADNLRKGAATNMVQIAELLDMVWTAAEA